LHCVICGNECEKRAVSCIYCGRMTHIDCVGFCEDVADVRGLQLVCRGCVFCGDEEYDWEKSMLRFVYHLRFVTLICYSVEFS